MQCIRENVKSFLPSRNVYETTEILLQQVKKYMSCFLEWLTSLLFHLPAVGCLIQSNAISDLSSVNITISRISGKISVWEGMAVASFKASLLQPVLLRADS